MGSDLENKAEKGGTLKWFLQAKCLIVSLSIWPNHLQKKKKYQSYYTVRGKE